MTTYTSDEHLTPLPRWRQLLSTGLIERLDWPTVGAFLLPFLLYVLTLAPTIYNLDSAELSTAAATGGIVRATGYPLYLLIGRIWGLLPVGDVGYRMNLLSAVCGALTIGLGWQILSRLKVNVWARVSALGLLATAPYFWAMSLIAEVYTLHTVLMAAVMLLLIHWYERPSLRLLSAAVFLLALSLGNHAATVLLAPACLFLVLSRTPKIIIQPRTWLVAGAALVAGLSIYLYLPLLYLSEPAFNYAGVYNALGDFIPVDLTTPSGLWWLISGKAFSGQMFAYDLNQLWPEINNFGVQLWLSFFAVGVGPGLYGLFRLLRRDWRLGTFFLMLFAANAIFYINYRVIDKNTMFLPAFLIWALWVGIGYQDLLSWFRISTRKRGSGSQEPPSNEGISAPLLVAEASFSATTLDATILDATSLKQLSLVGRVLMVMVVLLALVWNWQRVNLAHDDSTRVRGEAIMGVVEPNAIVLGWWDTVPVLEYLQLVEGQRPDVTAVNRFLISGPDMEALIAREIGKRPIYINSPPVYLLSTIDAVPAGPIYKLQPRLVQKEAATDMVNTEKE